MLRALKVEAEEVKFVAEELGLDAHKPVNLDAGAAQMAVGNLLVEDGSSMVIVRRNWDGAER